MTNLQANATPLSPQKLRLLWLALPAGAISLLALLLGALVLMPLWSALQTDSKRLRELQDLQDQVSLMRQQLSNQDQQEQRALAQKGKLVNLIAGNGDISTFLALLNREADSAGVQLDLYQPQAAAPAPGTPAAPAPAPAPTPGAAPGRPPSKQVSSDPLQAEGLQRSLMKIQARASYPRLLALLQRIEALSVLVEQSGLKLENKEPANTDANRPTQIAPVAMTINFSLYGRPPGGKPEAAATPASP